MSAYIRTVLCPDLAHAAVPRNTSLMGTLLADGGQHRGSGASTPTVGGHRHNVSWGSVDADLMRQFDQVWRTHASDTTTAACPHVGVYFNALRSLACPIYASS